MTIQAATPYLILHGRAREAIALYEKALGAKVAQLQRFGDMEGGCPEGHHDRVMHAELRIGGGTVMLADGIGVRELPPEGVVSIAVSLDDVQEAHRAFDALAASGKVVNQLFEAPWGALFGVAADGFGVEWMFNCTLKK